MGPEYGGRDLLQDLLSKEGQVRERWTDKDEPFVALVARAREGVVEPIVERDGSWLTGGHVGRRGTERLDNRDKVICREQKGADSPANLDPTNPELVACA